MKRAAYLVAVALAVLGATQVAAGAWIHAKALLAQRLIALSWDQSPQPGRARRPWPGADLRPIARLTVPARGVDLYVLDNAAPRTLAFGPGHLAGSAAPGAAGNAVLVAHRDTHFAFLRALERDDEIDVDLAGARRVRYRVSAIAIVERSDPSLVDDDGAARLTLVTCYPFDAVRPGSALRYVVIADRIG